MEHGREETEEELNEALRLRYQRMSLVKDPKITVRDNMGIIVLSIVLISLLLFISIFALVSHYTSSDNVSLKQAKNATATNVSKQTNMTEIDMDTGKFRVENDTACLDKNLESLSENNSSEGDRSNIDTENNANVTFKGTRISDKTNHNVSSTHSTDSIDSKTLNTILINNTTQREEENKTNNIDSLVNNTGILDREYNVSTNETTLVKSDGINNGSIISNLSDELSNTSNNASISCEADKLNNTKMSHNGKDQSNNTENTDRTDTAVKTANGVVNSIEATTTSLLSDLATTSNFNPHWNSRFLPDTVIPVHYDLYLDISIMSTSGWCYDSGMFTGNVTIYVIVRTSTDFIVIHANDLRLNADRIVIKRNNKHIRDHIEDITYNYEYEYYIIKISDFLDAGEYEVTIVEFMGCITNTSEGLVLSSYVTDAGEVRYLVASELQATDVVRYLVASQLQATDARKVFPCFDEPAMKATFSVSITHGEDYTALGNMPVLSTQCVGDCSRRKVTFEDTPIMSTYLLAFVVSDFRYSESILPENYTLRIWSQPEMVNQTLYALDFSIRTYAYFTDYFQLPDVVPKSDHVAVPDFSGGAMENWGLVIYRETALLYDPDVSSSSNKFMVTLIVAHEIAHTWFGNMVTMKWWDDLWLNEGFASTLMYFAMDHAYPDWKIPEMIVVEDMFPVMVKDALVTSHPVSPENLDNPDDIAESFDPISYNKGMAVLRMLEAFLGSDVFRLGLQMYVRKYKFKNAEMSELWQTFREASNYTYNISEIMDTWTRQMGYPVITVHEEGDYFRLEQERFLINTETTGPYNDSLFGYKWYVPFRYRTQEDPEVKVYWLNMGPGQIPKTSDGWLLGNVNFGGFFRTNYDLDMWRKLTHQLNTEHTVLPSANRAGLIGDAFNLARASMLDYAVALNLTTYLHHEQSYVPWKGFLEELEFIRGMLSKQSAYVLLEKYLRELIRPVLMKIGIRETDSLPDMYLRRMLLRTGCDVGVEEAIQYAKDKFDEWRFNGTRLPTDFAQVIYAVGVREGSVEEWDHMWIKSRLTNSPSEREMMLEALAHTQKPWLLWRYANWIFDEDKIKMQDVRLVMSYFSNTPLGRMIALHFLMNRWDDLNRQFGSDTFIIREMIGEVTAYVNTDFELKQLHLLFTEKPPKGARNGADSALALIRANINWMSTNYKPISNWLKQHVDSSF